MFVGVLRPSQRQEYLLHEKGAYAMRKTQQQCTAAAATTSRHGSLSPCVKQAGEISGGLPAV